MTDEGIIEEENQSFLPVALTKKSQQWAVGQASQRASTAVQGREEREPEGQLWGFTDTGPSSVRLCAVST